MKRDISRVLVLTPKSLQYHQFHLIRCIAEVLRRSESHLCPASHLSLFLSPFKMREALLLFLFLFYFWSFVEPRTTALHNSGMSSFNRYFSCFLSLFCAVNSKTRQPYKWKLFRDGKMPAERE